MLPLIILALNHCRDKCWIGTHTFVLILFRPPIRNSRGLFQQPCSLKPHLHIIHTPWFCSKNARHVSPFRSTPSRFAYVIYVVSLPLRRTAIRWCWRRCVTPPRSFGAEGPPPFKRDYTVVGWLPKRREGTAQHHLDYPLSLWIIARPTWPPNLSNT